MTFRAILRGILLVLAPISILSTIYLHYYPTFRGCAFSKPTTDHGQAVPFRLLAFGDPQLEGDTSLPSWPSLEYGEYRYLRERFNQRNDLPSREDIRKIARDIPHLVSYCLKYAQKQLDLIGNDYYLAHVYRTLHRQTSPTHVTVLGDLLGSQWITDEEFESRSTRFWKRVFKGASKPPQDRITEYDRTNSEYVVKSEILGEDDGWSRWIINVAGNHDIGYAGDILEGRIRRFEREFGPVNGDIRFTHPAAETPTEDQKVPTLRLVILNTMNLDGPQFAKHLANDTSTFINQAMTASEDVRNHNEAIILLTHIPLHKEEGICVDAPFFTYFEQHNGAGIREQNMLTPGSSTGAILQGLFGKHPRTDALARGMGRDGLILNGHDHEGCDVYHWIDRDTETWHARRWEASGTSELVTDKDQPGLREITVRSMMGEYGGGAALVSAWWDDTAERWQFEATSCQLGVQHIWWAINILDLVTVLLLLLYLSLRLPHAKQSRGTIVGRKRPSTTSKAKVKSDDHSKSIVKGQQLDRRKGQ